MEIRPMTIEDYGAVLSLWRACPGMGLNDVDDSREGIGRFLARNPDTCFAALDGDVVAGAILVGYDGRRAYIYHTAVRPEYRGQGLGGQLVEAALEALGKGGVSKVALVAFARNDSGNEFWKHLGFGERTDLVYRDRALVSMVREDT